MKLDKLTKNKNNNNKRKNDQVYRRFGSLLPDDLVSYLDQKLSFAGIKEDRRVWGGRLTTFGFLCGIIAMFSYLIVYNPITDINSILISIGAIALGFIAVGSAAYIWLYFAIADRSSSVEKVLPDFLMLTVSNLRAGMSPFAAFVHAARPEFGPFYDEVKLSIVKKGSNVPLTEILKDAAKSFDSQILQRTINLFAKGIHSGGQLAKLLSSSADEVRRIQDLRAELSSATRTYTIFLSFIIVIIMPFLLSVSTHFIIVFQKIGQERGAADIDTSASIPVFSGSILISPEQMMGMAIITLLMSSALVSFLIGIISKGKAFYGIKYFPLFAIASVVFFLITKAIVGSLLSAFSF